MTAGVSLVGRASEAETVRALIDQVPEHGATLIVRGDPGIGKSALLRASVERARERGMLVLGTAGVQSEAHLPFAGLHRLLRPILDHVTLLPDFQREALRAALGLSDVPAPETVRIALAVLDLLANAAARTPVLVIAEDAHWLDRSTIDVLVFIARRIEADPVVLLVATRDGYESIPADGGLPELRLEGLGADDAAVLLDAQDVELDPALRVRLLDTAAGNPLALVELPAAWRDLAGDAALPAWLPLTERLERAFVARTAEMTQPTRTLLLVAAADAEGLLSDVLRAAAAIANDTIGLDQLTSAVTAGLVEIDDVHVRFCHPLMRSAIYQAAGVAQRRAAHAALAGVFADQPDRRAWHRAASTLPPDEAIAAELESAAGEAQRRGGVSVAITALERAAQFSEDPGRHGQRLLHAAELGFELGRQDIVDRLLGQTEPLELGPVEQAQLSWLRGVFDEGLGSGAERMERLVRTAAQIGPDREPELALRLLWAAALQGWWCDASPAVRGRIVEVAERIPEIHGDPRRTAILAFAAPVERGARVMDALPGLAAVAANDPGAARVVGTAATAIGAFDLSAPLLATSAVGLRAQGRLGLLARALTLQAWSAAQRVDLAVAIPVADEAERLARESAQPLILAVAHATQAILAGLRGESTRTDALAGAAEQAGVAIDAHALLAAVQQARGLAALGDGRHAEAYEHLQRIHDPSDAAHHYFLGCFSIGDLAEAAAHSDQRDAAAPLVAETERLAADTPSPLLHASLGYARALLASDGDSEALFDAALRSNTQWPFLKARTQLAYGAWLRRHRRTAESRAPLRVARDTFEALGVLPWGERARQELRASGETSRRRTPDARDELSPQELQIAQLAADGLTNREIAHRLFLSHRTVASHLYRTFPKLGITSRAELREALRAAPR